MAELKLEDVFNGSTQTPCERPSNSSLIFLESLDSLLSKVIEIKATNKPKEKRNIVYQIYVATILDRSKSHS